MYLVQIAKLVSRDMLKTIHRLGAKPAKYFIHTVIKLQVEKIICHGPTL